jgi:hypothetical protein
MNKLRNSLLGIFVIGLCLSFVQDAQAVVTVNITSPGNGSSYTYPTNITIRATASAGFTNIYEMRYYNGGTILCDKFNGAPDPFSCVWNNLQPGSYTITVKAFTAVGESGTSAPVNIIVNIPIPAVSLTSPSSNASFNAPANIVLRAAASTNYGSIIKVEFYNGSSLLGTSFSSPYTYNWNNVVAGNYTLTAKAYGSAGPIGTASNVSVVVYKVPKFITFDNQCINRLPR